MKQMYGYSRSGDVAQATKGNVVNPRLVIFFCGKQYAESVAAEVEKAFPGVPSIGCVGMCYAGKEVYEDGLLVIGFEGVEAVTGVVDHVGKMPLASIESFQKDVQRIGAGREDTVCVDFTTGNDADLVTTLNIALLPKGIPLVGGTAWESTVFCDGKAYHDASAYALVRNLGGKVKAYKENLYSILPDSPRYVATKVDTSRNALLELDGKSPQRVYGEMLGLSTIVPADQTIENPLGRVIGDEIYLLSLNEAIENGGFTCYKKVNTMDIISLMKLNDLEETVQETLRQIESDFARPQGIFSINCFFRHLLFQKKNFEKQYFEGMLSVGSHAGLFGLGEHFNTQHVNQTMTGFVFD